MTQTKIEKLRELEKTVEKLQLIRARADERLLLLRQERNKLLKELKVQGVEPKDAEAKLIEMANKIDEDIAAIAAKIPHNVEDLFKDE